MLDKGRRREAEDNVKGYLEEGLLKKVGVPESNILKVFRSNSEESLKVADLVYREDCSYLWAVVCAYYSMYYITNAVLYSMGYKVGHKISHKVTSDALIVLVRGKLKRSLLEEFEEARDDAMEIANLRAGELIESFEFERARRSKFQYELIEEVKRDMANVSLERAKRFVFEMEKLLA